MSQPDPKAELSQLEEDLKELGYSSDAIKKMGLEEKIDRVANEESACGECHGEGEVETLAKQEGDNIIPGGFYEGSSEYVPCPSCQAPDESD